MPQTNLYNGTKKLYQFGGYVFGETNFNSDYSTTAKVQQSNSVLLDGAIRLNGYDRNTIDDRTITVSFRIKDTESIDNLQFEFFGQPKKIFFVHYEKRGFINILFNYAECINLTGHGFSSGDVFNQEFTATFRLMSPFLYKCQENLYLLDSKLFPVSNRTYWGDGVTTWGGGAIWGDTSSLGVNLDLVNQSFATMDKYFGCNCEAGFPLFYYDAFIKKEFYLPTATALTQTANLATVNNTFQTLSSNLQLKGTFENRLIVVKILAILQQNQWIEITNQDNNSSIRITWLDPSPLGSPNLVLFANDFELYNFDQGNVPITDNNRFQIDVNSEDSLYFSSHYQSTYDPYFPINENIKITTGQGGNILPLAGSITIYNQPTYII
jgi:hypothetical protein